MADASTHSSPRLLPVLALIGIAATLTVALVMLFPGQKYFTGLGVQIGETTSGVSIAYLRNLLRAEPGNTRLRLDLARELMNAGLYREAEELMAPLADSTDPDACWTRFELAWRRYVAASPGGAERAERRGRVEAQIELLPLEELSDRQLEALGRAWLALERPGRAALVYERLALRKGHGPNRLYFGEWWLNDPEEVIRRDAALSALKAARQSPEVDAVALARRLLADYPDYVALLDMAVAAAWENGDLETAMEWADRYAEMRPGDRAAVERKVTIELQGNRPDKAAVTLRGLLEKYPDAVAQREQLAKVLEWTERPGEALEQWRILAGKPGGNRYDREVVRLGMMLDDSEVVVQALGRLWRRGALASGDRRLLVEQLDLQGDPERAIRRLQRWLSSGRSDVELWRYLARLQEESGDLRGALATWQRYTGRRGRNLEETMQRARLNGRLWELETALSILESLPRKPGPEATEYWQLLGDYAWHVQRSETVRDAYAQLHRAGTLDALRYERLIVAALRTGDTDLGMEAAAAGWRQHREPALLAAALYEIREPGRLQSLFEMAGEAPEEVARRGDYWHLYGDYLYQRGDLKGAYEVYRRALTIDAGNSWLRAGFLYLLAESGRHEELARYLRQWRETARNDEILWPAYASGYTALRQPAEALPWYERAVREEPGDYLLLLDYADALDSMHRLDSAFRVRRYALTELRPRLLERLRAQEPRDVIQRQRDARIVGAQFDLLGSDANRDWLARVLADREPSRLDTVDAELLLGWYVSSQAPAYARYWHLHAQIRRLRTPAWQRMSVALAANDQPMVEELLRGESADLSVSDRIAGLRRLDRREEAQALALENVRAGAPWAPGIDEISRTAAELYREMPQRAGTWLSVSEVGGIAVYAGTTFVERSHERWGWAVDAGVTRLGNGDVRVVLDDLDLTSHLGLGLTFHQRRGETRFEVRGFEDDAADHLYLRLAQNYELTRNMQAGLFAETGGFSTDSGLLRAFSLRDRVGMSFEWALTSRDVLNLSASGSEYETREFGNDLGDGYTVEAVLSRVLVTGPTYGLNVRLVGLATRNKPARTLPPELDPRMPAGAIPADLVPREFGFVGAGIGFNRGAPAQPYPLVASPRYFVDVDAGYSSPDSDFAVSASAGVGIRVLGSDELSLTLGVDQDGTAGASRSSRAILGYQYFFGR